MVLCTTDTVSNSHEGSKLKKRGSYLILLSCNGRVSLISPRWKGHGTAEKGSSVVLRTTDTVSNSHEGSKLKKRGSYLILLSCNGRVSLICPRWKGHGTAEKRSSVVLCTTDTVSTSHEGSKL